MEIERRRVIEEERQHFLANAAPLRDFFPKGTYERESDLELVGEQLPPRLPGNNHRPSSLGRVASQGQLRGSAASSAGSIGVASGARPVRPASLGPGRPAGMRHAWETPPGSPGADALHVAVPARQQRRLPMGG